MAEHVEKWHGISIWWPRPPRSLKGALYRLGEMGQAIFWMKSDIGYGEMAREELRQQIRHLENLLEARWIANDAQFSPSECPCGQKVCTVGRSATYPVKGEWTLADTIRNPIGNDRPSADLNFSDHAKEGK